MPKLLPAGFTDVCVAFLRTGDQEEMCVTFGVASGSEEDPFAIATSVALDWAAAIPAANLPNVVHGTRVTTRVSQGDDPPLIGEAALAQTGTASGSTLPQNCAYIFRKATSFGGRRGRGRMFLPWALANDITATGVISTTAVSNYNSLGATLLSNLNSGTAGTKISPMVILHNDGGPSTPGPSVVTSLTLDPVIGTQRRRLRH